MRRGFILLEIMIATAIASVVSLILLNSVTMLNRGYARLEDRMAYFMRMVTTQHQLERDLMGAFVPLRAESDKGQKKKDQDQEKEDATAPAGEQEHADKKQQKPKPVKNVFVGTQEDDRFQMLSCVTANIPGISLSSGARGEAKAIRPRVTRVVYRLIPDDEKKDALRLVRQQGTELDLGAYEIKSDGSGQVRPFTLAREIKEFSVAYIWRELPGKRKKAGAEADKDKIVKQDAKKTETQKREYHRSAVWPPAGIDKEKQKRVPPMPERIAFNIILWERGRERKEQFEFSVPLLVDHVTKAQETKGEQEKKHTKGQEARAVPDQAQGKPQVLSGKVDYYEFTFGKPRSVATTGG